MNNIPTQKEIANALRAVAAYAPEYMDIPERCTVLTLGPVTIRCVPTRPAILRVAEKFEKRTVSIFNPPKYRRPHRGGLRQVAAQWERNGDLANAAELLR